MKGQVFPRLEKNDHVIYVGGEVFVPEDEVGHASSVQLFISGTYRTVVEVHLKDGHNLWIDCSLKEFADKMGTEQPA